ncbi:2400_t:CDS:2, partial [Dentiscutata erythropus]
TSLIDIDDGSKNTNNNAINHVTPPHMNIIDPVNVDQFGVEDIRYLPNKQFAHVDLKNEVAMKKALKLHGETKVPEQGKLRVEEGKPRNAST